MSSEYYFQAEADLETHRDRIARWNRRELEGLDEEMERHYYEDIQALESKCDTAEIALNTCKFAPKEKKEDRDALEKALDDVREAVGRFTDRFGL